MHRFAVIGNPIAHSLSPRIHTHFAQQINAHIDYEKVHIEEFNTALPSLQETYLGINVTVPFKVDAYGCATQLSGSAQQSGAVNTLFFKENTIFGDNTDGIGLCNDLVYNKHVTLKDKIILIIGAGGASRGIIPALLAHQPKRIMIANRTANKAVALAQDFAHLGKTCGFGLEKIKDAPVDIVINATSVGLGGQVPNIASGCVQGAVFYDLSYGKTTEFMQWATLHHAAHVYDGWGMLVEQAACSFILWHYHLSTDDLIAGNARVSDYLDTSELIQTKLES